MARPESFASDEQFHDAWDRRCAAHYRAMVSLRYHRKRQRFFDLLDKWTKALTVLAGASLLAEPIRQAVPVVAVAISGAGLLSLAFGYGDRKQAHKELADSFAFCAAAIEGTPGSALSASLVAEWESEVAALCAKEPPQLHTLVTICEREQSVANGHPEHIAAPPWPKRFVASWL
jgi:hypothetical protein